jgi:hypothetical protein
MFERWVIGVVVVLAGLYALRVLWSEWRGENGPDLYRAPDWWPLDLPVWRALVVDEWKGAPMPRHRPPGDAGRPA